MANNPAMLLLPGNGVLTGTDRGGVVSAVATGPLRYKPGKLDNSQAFWVEEATTNYLNNPAFNVDLASWTNNAGTETITRDTAVLYEGWNTQKAVTVGGGGWHGIASAVNSQSPALTGQTWTMSGWIYPTTAMYYSPFINERTSAGTQVLGHQGAGRSLVANAWNYVKDTMTLSGGATVTQISVHFTTNEATTFYLAKPSLEQKAYPTSAAAGSLGTGYAWTGTSNASSSTRAATTIRVDETNRINAQRGSLAVWFWRDAVPNNDRYLFSAGRYYVAGSDWVELVVRATGGLYTRWQRGAAGVFNLAEPVGSAGIATWHLAYIEWDGTTFGASLNNGTLGAGTRETPNGNLASALDMGIGFQSQDTVEMVNGRIGPLIIFDRQLTTAERSKLYARPYPWTLGMFGDVGGLIRVGV